MAYGGHNMHATLRRVLLKRIDEGSNVDHVKWHYTSKIDIAAAILKANGVEVEYHTVPPVLELSDSIFVHDPAFITDKGAIMFQMGKKVRKGEPAELEKTFTRLGIPILYRLHGDATAEDEKTVGVGRGYRTNAEGIRQLQEALAPLGIKVLEFHLPYFWGPEACLHLQSIVSIIGEKQAVYYPPLCPVPLIQALNERGFTLVEVPQNEFEATQGTLNLARNVLGITKGKVITIENNPVTKKRLEDLGIEVLTYKGNEITLKMEGGATCLTRVLYRSN